MRAPSMKALALTIACMAGAVSFVDAQTLKKIEDNNKITVSYRESAVPFSYLVSPNKPVGFAVDLTDAIVADVRTKLGKPGLEVALMPVSAQNRIPLLIDGSYDLECGSTTNNAARGKDVTFAISHFYTGTRLLAKKTSNVRTYRDLDKKSVVTTGGSTNEKVLRKYAADNNIDMQIVLAKDYGDAFSMVETGQATAFAMDDILLFGLMANSTNPAAFEVVGDTLQVEPYGCMIRKDDPEFQKVVNGTITRLMQSGEFTKLYEKWFNAAIPPKNVVLNMPMSTQLRNNLKELSDKPAQ